MDEATQAVLDGGGVIDITTTGRKSGKKRRIVIDFSRLDGRYYITGRPGRPRDWLANLYAEPGFMVHLKAGSTADLAAVARPITEVDERTTVLYRILTESWDTDPERAGAMLPKLVEGAPLIEFELT